VTSSKLRWRAQPSTTARLQESSTQVRLIQALPICHAIHLSCNHAFQNQSMVEHEPGLTATYLLLAVTIAESACGGRPPGSSSSEWPQADMG